MLRMLFRRLRAPLPFQQRTLRKMNGDAVAQPDNGNAMVPQPDPVVPQLEIKQLEDWNFSHVCDFLREEYRLREPLFRSVKVSEAESNEAVEAISNEIDYDYSYCVWHEELEETIIALRLSSIHERPEGNEIPPITDEEQFVSWKNRAADDLLHELKRQAWKRLPEDITKIMNIDVIGVDQAYYRRGLARRLCEYDLDELKKDGIQAITSELTNLSSQQLFLNRLGYTALHEIRYDEWLGHKGTPIFDCSKFPELNGTASVVLVYKRL